MKTLVDWICKKKFQKLQYLNDQKDQTGKKAKLNQDDQWDKKTW